MPRKRRSKRQRLKADPANQPLTKLKAWAKKEGLEAIGLSGLLSIPRLGATPNDAEHPKVKPGLRRQERYINSLPTYEELYGEPEVDEIDTCLNSLNQGINHDRTEQHG